jgi:hypothetical protein
MRCSAHADKFPECCLQQKSIFSSKKGIMSDPDPYISSPNPLQNVGK